MLSLCAGPSRPRRGPMASRGRAEGARQDQAQQRVAACCQPQPSAEARTEAPPTAKPRAVRRPVRRVVLRARGAATPGTRSAKIRRLHRALSQNRRRTVGRWTACAPRADGEVRSSGCGRAWGGRLKRAKTYGKKRERGQHSYDFGHKRGLFSPAPDTDSRFIACNHGVQAATVQFYTRGPSDLSRTSKDRIEP